MYLRTAEENIAKNIMVKNFLKNTKMGILVNFLNFTNLCIFLFLIKPHLPKLFAHFFKIIYHIVST